jgi:hypothetical protein
MKKIRIPVIGLLIILNCAFKAGNDRCKHDLLLTATNIGTYDLSECDSLLYNLIELQLTNKTDSICSFLVFDGATAASVTIDPEVIEICHLFFTSNRPTTIILKPDQVFSMFIITKTLNKNNLLLKNVRFGIVIFPPKVLGPGFFSDDIAKMKQNRENIIWSEPIDMEIFGGESFMIK